jgi:hypothetical protein
VSSVGQNHVVTNDSNRLSQRQNLFIAALAVRRYLQKVSTLFHSYLCKVARPRPPARRMRIASHIFRSSLGNLK